MTQPNRTGLTALSARPLELAQGADDGVVQGDRSLSPGRPSESAGVGGRLRSEAPVHARTPGAEHPFGARWAPQAPFEKPGFFLFGLVSDRHALSIQ